MPLWMGSWVSISIGPSPLFSSNILSLQPSNLSKWNQVIELPVLRLSLSTSSPCSSVHLTLHHQQAHHSTVCITSWPCSSFHSTWSPRPIHHLNYPNLDWSVISKNLPSILLIQLLLLHVFSIVSFDQSHLLQQKAFLQAHILNSVLQ